MSGTLATKRRRLAFSFTALVIAYAVFVLVQDYFRFVWEGLTPEDLADIQEHNSQSQWIAIAFFGAPAIWWHVADFASRYEPQKTFSRLLATYRLFGSILIFGLAGAAVVFSGITERIQCRPPKPTVNADGIEFGFFCTPNPAYGVEVLVILPALLLILLALAKTCLTAISWAKSAA